MLPSETRRRIALADAKKPTAQHAGNQDLVDVFWVLADATFKAEPENAGTKGSAYRKAAQAFAACAFAQRSASRWSCSPKLPVESPAAACSALAKKPKLFSR